MVLHQRHVGDEIRRGDELGFGVAARDHDVKAVPGETNLDNNSAQYPVIFSLG